MKLIINWTISLIFALVGLSIITSVEDAALGLSVPIVFGTAFLILIVGMKIDNGKRQYHHPPLW